MNHHYWFEPMGFENTELTLTSQVYILWQAQPKPVLFIDFQVSILNSVLNATEIAVSSLPKFLFFSPDCTVLFCLSDGIRNLIKPQDTIAPR